MDKKEYWWVDMPNGALLFARPYYDDEKIGYVTQDGENEYWWHCTCDYFKALSDSFIASDLDEAKDYLLNIIQSEIDGQIKYYNQMVELFS